MDMLTRISHATVTFARPFSLSGFVEPFPAGAYTVETEEELLPNLSFVAYRRTATWLHFTQRPGSRSLATVAMVDPEELAQALAQDVTPDLPMTGHSRQPDAGA